MIIISEINVLDFSLYDFVVALLAFPLLIMTLTVIINSIAGPKLSKTINYNKSKLPFVSVLIPARNEEGNIEKCLSSLLVQDYPNFEVIVLDDNSEDNTWEIIKKIQYNSERLTSIKGEELIDGWFGKPHACMQLSKRAIGDILIFTDADNTYEINAISNSVAFIQKYNLDMFSAFPEQINKSFFEKIIVSVLDLIIYSGFILWSAYFFKNKAFASANGQWLVFRKSAYEEIGGHTRVKNNITEDVALARLIKSNNKKLLVASGKGMIYTRMYSNLREIFSGFSKNLFGIADNKPILFTILICLFIDLALLPFVSLFTKPILISIIMGLYTIWNMFLIFEFKQSKLNLLFRSLGLLMFVAIGIKSMYNNYFGVLSWKGRNYSTKKGNRQ